MSRDIQTSFDKFILPKLASFHDILISALNKSCVTQMSLNFLRPFLNIVQQLHKSYVCTCACACFYPCACAPAVVGLGLVCGLVCHQVAPCAPAPPHTPLQARFCTGIMRRKMVITMIMIIGMIMMINVLLCRPGSLRKRVTKMIENDHTLPKLPPFA